MLNRASSKSYLLWLWVPKVSFFRSGSCLYVRVCWSRSVSHLCFIPEGPGGHFPQSAGHRDPSLLLLFSRVKYNICTIGKWFCMIAILIKSFETWECSCQTGSLVSECKSHYSKWNQECERNKSYSYISFSDCFSNSEWNLCIESYSELKRQWRNILWIDL